LTDFAHLLVYFGLLGGDLL